MPGAWETGGDTPPGTFGVSAGSEGAGARQSVSGKTPPRGSWRLDDRASHSGSDIRRPPRHRTRSTTARHTPTATPACAVNRPPHRDVIIHKLIEGYDVAHRTHRDIRRRQQTPDPKLPRIGMGFLEAIDLHHPRQPDIAGRLLRPPFAVHEPGKVLGLEWIMKPGFLGVSGSVNLSDILMPWKLAIFCSIRGVGKRAV